MLSNSKKNLSKRIYMWEIWKGDEFLGITMSLQIAELAREKGLVIVMVEE